jgi:folate-binding protein YgfZ
VPEAASKVSPLARVAARLGARFEPRDGMPLPADYGNPAAEAGAILRSAAVVDRSAIGRFKVTGRDRHAFLQRMSTQNLKDALVPGRTAASAFLTGKGRIVDLAVLGECGDWTLLLTSPPAQVEPGSKPLAAFLRGYVLADDVVFTDLSAEGGAFRVTGPRAEEVLRSLGDIPVSALGGDRMAGVLLSGIETTILAEAAGPRPSWLLLADAPAVADLFEAACGVAKALGGGPCGETAREAVRVDDGIPEAGHEITEDFNPWEARLDAAISLTKGCYIGQEVVARLNTYDKVNKRLARLELVTGGSSLPAAWAPGSKLSFEGHDVGVLTSVAGDFVTGRPIALGLVKMSWLEEGTLLDVRPEPGAGEPLKARVRPAPAPVQPAGGDA